MPNPLKFVARSLLGSVFLGGGLNQVKATAAIAPAVNGAAVEYGITLPTTAENIVKANGIGMIAAGAAMALGIKPRTSALALIGMLVPTTLVGHPFWKNEDPQEKQHNTNSFFANAAIVGGLLMVVLDRKK